MLGLEVLILIDRCVEGKAQLFSHLSLPTLTLAVCKLHYSCSDLIYRFILFNVGAVRARGCVRLSLRAGTLFFEWWRDCTWASNVT